MANYEYCERTNYFPVRDESAFRQLALRLDAKVIEEMDGETKTYCLLPNGEGFASSFENEDGEECEIDIIDELRKHVAPGWVACVAKGGHENLRYIGYQLSCVDSDGHAWSKGNSDLMSEARLEFSGLKFGSPEY